MSYACLILPIYAKGARKSSREEVSFFFLKVSVLAQPIE